jgi:hypothetical protein
MSDCAPFSVNSSAPSCLNASIARPLGSQQPWRALRILFAPATVIADEDAREEKLNVEERKAMLTNRNTFALVLCLLSSLTAGAQDQQPASVSG